MDDQFYLQDSRDHVGDGVLFWAQGGGYCTDIGRAEVFTRDSAIRHNEDRESDVPWPKAYVDERAHTGVDCQYVSREEAEPLLGDDCQCVVQVRGEWNGNDLIWARWPIGVSPRLERAHRMDYAATKDLSENEIIWPAAYIKSKGRLLVHRQDVLIKDALRGSGIKLATPKKFKQPMLNCTGCGRFISVYQSFQEDCRNCGADNLP